MYFFLYACVRYELPQWWPDFQYQHAANSWKCAHAPIVWHNSYMELHPSFVIYLPKIKLLHIYLPTRWAHENTCWEICCVWASEPYTLNDSDLNSWNTTTNTLLHIGTLTRMYSHKHTNANTHTTTHLHKYTHTLTLTCICHGLFIFIHLRICAKSRHSYLINGWNMK